MTVAQSRLAAIDALRGFGLLGIVLVNQAAFRSGIAAGFPGTASLGGGGWGSTLVDAAIQWLVAGKFILIFAFMLGWGIHTQVARGDGFRGRYLRRLLGLLLLGIAHGIFLFAGDILAAYAVLGLFMLRPIRHDWPVRKLVRNAVMWMVVQAVVLVAIAGLMAAAPGDDTLFMDLARRGVEIYRTGSFWAVTEQRLGDFAGALPATVLLLGWGLVAMFRLGLAAAKTFVEGGTAAILAAARRVVWPALIVGVVGNGACAVVAPGLPDLSAASVVMLQMGLLAPVLSLGYLAAAALLLMPAEPQQAEAGFLFRVLATAGRMSLSIYLGQSIVMSLLYHGYGLGLSSQLTSAGSVAVCLAVYAVLVAFSRLWLGVFRIGPFEWLLRSFTEWRWVALRPRADVSATATAA